MEEQRGYVKLKCRIKHWYDINGIYDHDDLCSNALSCVVTDFRNADGFVTTRIYEFYCRFHGEIHCNTMKTKHDAESKVVF